MGIELFQLVTVFAVIHSGIRQYTVDIDGKQWAVLVTIASGEELSQQDAADALGIDRTTMVALIDGLEDKGLVRRSRHPDDRRKNVVELTANGRRTLGRARTAVAAAEKTFFAPLSPDDADEFKASLRMLLREA